MFETTSTRIPSNRTVAVDEDGYVAAAPAAWFVPGYWGDEYSETPISRAQRLAFVEDYRRELVTILAES